MFHKLKNFAVLDSWLRRRVAFIITVIVAFVYATIVIVAIIIESCVAVVAASLIIAIANTIIGSATQNSQSVITANGCIIYNSIVLLNRDIWVNFLPLLLCLHLVLLF